MPLRVPACAHAMVAVAVVLGAATVRAQTPSGLHGDVGAALYRTTAVAATADRSDVVLPYLYADWGRWLARVDTFGYRAVKLAQGHLELVARVSFEGYRPRDPAFDRRSTPLPVGVGTFQETAAGAFIVYAFRDAVSGGTLVDASYAAQLDAGALHFYPQVGFERRSARYVRHLYGVGTEEARRADTAAWAPGNALDPTAAVAVEYDLTSTLKLTTQVRRRWLDDSIRRSPLVQARTQTTSLLAITRTFP